MMIYSFLGFAAINIMAFVCFSYAFSSYHARARLVPGTACHEEHYGAATFFTWASLVMGIVLVVVGFLVKSPMERWEMSHILSIQQDVEAQMLEDGLVQALDVKSVCERINQREGKE